MQVFAIKMHNFLRFGEINNSVVFDISDEDKQLISAGDLTIDGVYNKLAEDPYKFIQDAKARGIAPIFGIIGMINGNSESSNGSGKSSILEAICYAHYGRIVRLSANSDRKGEAGLAVVTKINKVIPDYVKESWVEEFFEADGKIYRIKRGRTFTKTKKNSTPIFEFECFNEHGSSLEHGHKSTETKKTIEEINDMSYELFVNSRMFGQSDAGKFLTGGDKVKKEMIIELLNMTSFVAGCQEKVKKKRSLHESNAESLRQSSASYVSQIKSIYNKYSPNQVESYTPSLISEFNLIMSGKMEDMQISIFDLDKKITSNNEKIIELSKSESIVIADKIKQEGVVLTKEKNDKLAQIKEQVEGWEKSLEETNDKIRGLEDEVDLCEKSIEQTSNCILSKQRSINEFDLVAQQNVISTAAKAKEAKPKYEGLLTKLNSDKNIVIEQIGRSKADQETLVSTLDKFKKQKLQLGQSGVLVCHECGSEVAESHIDSKINENQKGLGVVESKLVQLAMEQKEIDAKIADVKAKLEKIQTFIYGETSALKKINDFNNLGKELEASKKELETHKQRRTAIDAELKVLKGKRTATEDRIKQIRAQHDISINELTVKIAALKEKYLFAQEKAKTVTSEIDLLKKDKDVLEKNKQTLNQQIGSMAKEHELFKSHSDKVKSLADEMDKELKAVERFDKLLVVFGLDGIQTRIVKKYLPLLNMYLKEFINILTDGAISVQMSINDKSDMEMIISGGTSDLYDLLSGGEKMLVRLAVDVSLAMLSFARSSKKPEVIYLDEIFGPLDGKNTKAVLRMLDALRGKFSRVILITHNDELKEMIPNNILVSKSGGMHGLSEIKSIN